LILICPFVAVKQRLAFICHGPRRAGSASPLSGARSFWRRHWGRTGSVRRRVVCSTPAHAGRGCGNHHGRTRAALATATATAISGLGDQHRSCVCPCRTRRGGSLVHAIDRDSSTPIYCFQNRGLADPLGVAHACRTAGIS